MRRVRRELEKAESLSVDMSAMVDLSFLLLVFFLVTTTLLAKEQDLPLVVPPHDGVPIESKPVVLRVEEDNRVILHPDQIYHEEVVAANEGHELPSLQERLVMLKSGGVGFIVDVADGASYQRFVDVLNCLQGEGCQEVGITFH